MAELVNMKIDPKEREEKYKESALVDRPIYPYGLSLNLDDDVMEKLGLASLPAAGDTLTLTAVVTVTNVSENSYADAKGGKAKTCQSMSLQITDMGLGPAPSKDAAKSLYSE